MAYASVDDLTAYLDPDPLPAAPQRLLDTASDMVDDLLIGAWYDTDADGNPTDPALVQAFSKATCAQAHYLMLLGDETGAMENVASMTVGSVTITRGQNARTGLGKGGGVKTSRIAPRAITILRQAGLLPIRVITGWGAP